MANQITYVTVPSATRVMVAAKLEELKFSLDQLDEGQQLDHAYSIINSISRKPYQFHITGPVKILPGYTDVGVNLIVPPVAVPWDPKPSATPASGVHAASDPATANVHCPNCGHDLTIKISL